MILMKTKYISSKRLLTHILRWGTSDEITRTNIATIATIYDPSSEIRVNSYDSPWRSLALVFSFADKSKLASMAFNKANNWFDAVLDTDTVHTVLRGARLTMRILCQIQEDQGDKISNESFQEVTKCLENIKLNDPNPWVRRNLHSNYARLSFIASYYGLEESSVFAKKEYMCYKPSHEVHSSINFLVEEFDLLWRTAVFAVEVGDRNILCNNFLRMLSFADTLQQASHKGAWEVGKDLGISRVLASYLSAVDLCVPTPSEANQAVDIVVNFLASHEIQPNQLIQERATLLLAKSAFSPVVCFGSVSEIITFWQDAIPLCIETAGRLGLSRDLLVRKISHAMTEFIETSVVRFCSDEKNLNSQMQIIHSIYSNARKEMIPIEDEAWQILAGVLLKPSTTLTDIINDCQITTASEQFGSELRVCIDRSLDYKLPFTQHLKSRALTLCDRFFEVAVEELLPSQDVSANVYSSLRQAEMVYTYAGFEPRGETLWKTALHCLKYGSPLVVLSVLTTWILKNQYMKEKLWINLDKVLELLSEHHKAAPSLLSSGVTILMRSNSSEVLRFLFGSDPEVQEIMLPVVRCILKTEEQQKAQEALLSLVTANRGSFFDYEQLARETVAFLLSVVHEDSAEYLIYSQAARQLISRKIAILNTREGPQLSPIVTKLMTIQLRGASSAYLILQLVSKGESEEIASIDLVNAISTLSDKDAIELLNIMCQSAASYSHSEFSTVHNLVLELLTRESIMYHFKENLAKEERNSVSQLLLRWFPPTPPAGSWSSRSWSGNPENACSHDRAFSSCRHLLVFLLQSSVQTAHNTLNTLTLWNCTTIWGLARWLADIRIIVEELSTTVELLDIACRECLVAILTSRYKSMTYYGEGENTIWWREEHDLPAIVIDLILPQILNYAADVVCSLPEEVDQYNERRQVLCSAIPVLLAKGVLTPLCTDLIDRIPGLRYWGEGRTLCLSFIEKALLIDIDQDNAEPRMSILKRVSSKKHWTAEGDVVSLLCGLPGTTGDEFTKVFYKHVTPTEIINNEKLWSRIKWVTREIKAFSDLSTRLKEVTKSAQKKASTKHKRRKCIGAWAVAISAICSNIRGYRSSHISPMYAIHVIEFLNISMFGQRVEELWMELSREKNSTKEAIDEALDDWERVVISLIEEIPDKSKLNRVGIARLLSLRILQAKFRRVNEIINTMSRTNLVLQNPELVTACMEVCLRQQDLDGIETLFYRGLAATSKSSPELGADFLTNALISFWHLGEFHLSLLLLKSILRQLRTSPHEVHEGILRDILNLANEKLKLEFQDPPDLSFYISNGFGYKGGE